MVKTTVCDHFCQTIQEIVERLDQADEDAAQDRALQVADAAEDGGSERDEAELEAGVVAGGPERLEEQQARRAGRRPTEAEGEGDRAVDVDAHEPRRICAVARMALPWRVRCTVAQDQQQRHRDHDDDDGRPVDLHVADLRPAVGDALGQLLGAEPLSTRPNHWKMKEMPTAVMSGASLGARRSRRYAMYSAPT